MSKLTLKQQVMETAKAYSIACSIGCAVIDRAGNMQQAFPSASAADFCNLVAPPGHDDASCRHARLYGGYQAEMLGHYYIYFCPFGLGNWAVPVYRRGAAQYYLIGGPVLLHKVDSLLLQDILRNKEEIGVTQKKLAAILKQVPVVAPTRVRYLAQVLLSLAQALMPDERHHLEERHRFTELCGQIVSQKGGGEELVAYKLENELSRRVKMADLQGAREILNEILGHIYFKDSSFEIKKARLIALMAVLGRASLEAGADLEIVFGIEYKYLRKMAQTPELMELSALVARVLERFVDCAFLLQDAKNRDLMYRATNYIRNNYGNDISLEDVALEVGLHPTYFSKLFKEEMKMTYSTYLNYVRIEEAKQLIRRARPLVEVAQAVGFNDQSYFSRIFKRIEGVSPGKWRAGRFLG